MKGKMVLHRIITAILCFLLILPINACAPGIDNSLVELNDNVDPIAAITLVNTKVSTNPIDRSKTSTLSFTPTFKLFTVTSSSTPSPLPSSTRTSNAKASLTNQAAELEQTKLASFDPNCESGIVTSYKLSPEGNWLASSCGYAGDETLEIKNKESIQWVLHFKDFLRDEYIIDGHTPEGGLYPVRWTVDGRYLYFVPVISVDGGGICFYGSGVLSLYRIDVRTGFVSATLDYSAKGYIFKFSHQGDKLAYIGDNFEILDLRTGEITRHINKFDGNIGDLTWSPDGTKLMYATCQSDTDKLEVIQSSIQIYSLEMHLSNTILKSIGNKLSIYYELDDSGSSVIYEQNERNDVFNTFLFDWASDHIMTPTVEP